MKKILGLLLSIMLILSLTACLEKPSSDKESSHTSKNSESTNSNPEMDFNWEDLDIESAKDEDDEAELPELPEFGNQGDDGLLDSDDDGVIETPYI